MHDPIEACSRKQFIAVLFDGSEAQNTQSHEGNTKNNWPTDSHDVPNIDPKTYSTRFRGQDIKLTSSTLRRSQILVVRQFIFYLNRDK